MMKLVNVHVLIFVSSLAFAGQAFGWNGFEHEWIGTTAYSGACNQAMERFGKVSDPVVAARLRIACRAVPNASGGYEYAPLLGEWSAIAADHADRPEQLTSMTLGDVVANYLKLTRLAVTNYRHFHPASVTSWRSYHRDAVLAAEQAQSEGETLAEEFEHALSIEAFAQHYLADSFAAGHMGFNRLASSNAASLLQHDRANKEGRCVANRNGAAWFTYGDDALSKGESAHHVVQAASLSLDDFLSAFITAGAGQDAWEAVWDELPAYTTERLGQHGTCTLNDDYISLRSVSAPAEPIYTLEFAWVRDRAAYYDPPVMQGLMLGGSSDLGAIPLGYRNIQIRGVLAVGESVYGRGKHALLGDAEFLFRVGTTAHGTLTHEVGLGLDWFWARREHFQSDGQRLIYAVNIEAGLVFVRFQAGVSWGYVHGYQRITTGPRISLGVGRVIGSRARRW